MLSTKISIFIIASFIQYDFVLLSYCFLIISHVSLLFGEFFTSTRVCTCSKFALLVPLNNGLRHKTTTRDEMTKTPPPL